MRPEAPPRPGEVVEHLRLRELVLGGKRRVGWALLVRRIGEIVGLEDGDVRRPVALAGFLAEHLQREGEHAAHPLLAEARVQRLLLGGDGGDVVERQLHGPAAALHPPRRLPLVRHEAIGADAKERAKAALRRIEPVEPPLFQRGGEEVLRQILGVRVTERPSLPEEVEHRRTVGAHEKLRRVPSLLGIVGAERLQHGDSGIGEGGRRESGEGDDGK